MNAMKNDTQALVDRARAMADGDSSTVGEVVGELTRFMFVMRVINTPSSWALYNIMDAGRLPYLDVTEWSPDDIAPNELKLVALAAGLMPLEGLK